MAFEKPVEDTDNRNTLFGFHIYLVVVSLVILGLLGYGIYIGRTSEWEIAVGCVFAIVSFRQLLVSGQEVWRLKDIVETKRGKQK